MRGVAAVLTLWCLAGCNPSESALGPDGGDNSHSGNPDAGPPDGGDGERISIAGRVMDVDHHPLANAKVMVASGTFQRTTVADDQGRFTSEDVPVPYEVRVAVTVEGIPLGVAYLGLHREDPTIEVPIRPTAQRRGVLDGRLDGGVVPLLPDQKALVFFAAPPYQGEAFARADGRHSVEVSWTGQAELSGSLRALEWTADAGLPVSYQGYGQRPNVRFTDTVTVHDQDILLAPVASGTLSGASSVPPDYRVFQRSFGAYFGANQLVTFGAEDFPAGTAFSYLVPTLPDSNTFVTLQAAGPNDEFAIVIRQGLAAGNSGVSLQMLAATSLAAPAPRATGVSLSTPFNWSRVPGNVHLLLAVQSGAEGQVLAVLTEGNSATLPDLGALGRPFPRAASFSWAVLNFGPFPDVDTAAGPAGIAGLGQPLAPNPHAAETYFGLSALRGFTTAP